MRRTLSVGGFAPDLHDYGQLHLERCVNLIPIHGELRPVNWYQSVARIASSNNVTGGYCHILTRDLDVQTARAFSTNTTGNWDEDFATPGGDLHEQIDEVTPDDTDFIVAKSTAQNPSFSQCKIKIDDLDDPDPDNTNHKLTVRVKAQYNPDTYTGATSNFIANIYHYDGVSTWTQVSTADLIDETALENDVWYTFTGTIDTADITALWALGPNEYDNLYLVFEGDFANSAAPSPYNADPTNVEDNEGNWEWYDETSVASHISDLAQGTGSYATSHMVTPGLSRDEEASIELYIPSIPVHVQESQNTYVGYVAITDNTGEMDIRAELINADTDEVISVDEETVSADDWGTPLIREWGLSAGENIDYNSGKSNCKLRITAQALSDTGSSTQYRPTAHVSNFWDSQNNIHLLLDDTPDNDSTYVETVDTLSAQGRFEVSMGSLAKPTDKSGVKFRFRAQKVSGADRTFKVTITDGKGGEVVLNYNNVTDSSFKNYYASISESKVDELDWDETWNVKVQVIGGNTGKYRVSELGLIAQSEGSKLYVAEAYVEREVYSNYQVSWAKFTAPSTTDNVTGDLMRIYGGTKKELYQVEDIDTGDISDVTNYTDYASGYGQTNQPQAWNFCSWGGNVVATNFEDGIQWMDIENGAIEFDDLLVSNTDANAVTGVKAKFVDVVQNNLVIANINHNDYTPYSVGWSYFDDPTKFAAPSYSNLSDFQTLRQTPGEITGLVGGDYGIIFKRNSIYRMSYVGAPIMYRFDVIARGVGTARPNSIVVANDIIYFWDGNAFQAIQGGNAPVPISDGAVSRMLTDHILDGFTFDNVAANQRAYLPGVYSNTRGYDISMCGAYDRTTSTIWWVYTAPGDTTGANWKSKAVTYNTRTGQWGFVDFNTYPDTVRIANEQAGIRVSFPVGLTNDPPLGAFPEYQPSPGIVFWSKDYNGGSNIELWRNSSVNTRPSSLLTSVIIPDVLGLEPGSRFSIRAIRPVWANVNTNADILRDVTITVYGSDDLEFFASESDSATLADNSDLNGWYSVKPISASAFKIGMDIPIGYENFTWGGNTTGIVPGLIALQLEFEPSGKL